MKSQKRMPPGYGAEFQYIHRISESTILAEAQSLKAIHECSGVEIAISAYRDLATHRIVADLYRTAENIGIHDLQTLTVPDYGLGDIQVACAFATDTDLITFKMAVT